MRTAIVLPPREGFSTDAVGAIGLLVHRLSGPDDLVLGRADIVSPFTDRHFLPVAPAGFPLLRAPLRYAAGVARLLKLQAIDTIEVHNRPDVAALLARRFPHLPVGLVLHNDPRGMRLASSRAARRSLAARVRIAVVSDYLAGLYPEATVSVLPNCLDLSALPKRLVRRDRTILFVGRMVADKGADAFVDAAETLLPSLPGWRMEMIGSDRFRSAAPDTPFERRLRPRAEQAGIVLSGYRTHAQTMAAMARAAIVVVPSRWFEPFGMTALEAMASGAALVCSGRGGLAALVGDAALIADPDATVALPAAIRTLADSPSLRARLAEAGRTRAAGHDLPEAKARLLAWRAQAL
jgi:UDP-glucose:(glucosyl)LPS alpha-1,2-glucosyltransferase